MPLSPNFMSFVYLVDFFGKAGFVVAFAANLAAVILQWASTAMHLVSCLKWWISVILVQPVMDIEASFCLLSNLSQLVFDSCRLRASEAYSSDDLFKALYTHVEPSFCRPDFELVSVLETEFLWLATFTFSASLLKVKPWSNVTPSSFSSFTVGIWLSPSLTFNSFFHSFFHDEIKRVEHFAGDAKSCFSFR